MTIPSSPLAGAASRLSRVLVSDFDGTMTRHDFYQLVRARWWDGTGPDPWEEYLAGRLTHFEALNCFFRRIRADERSLREFIAQMELDANLPGALHRLHEAGWQLVIASAGCEWYIRHLLHAVTTPFILHANPGRFLPGGGLEMVLPLDSPFYDPQTGINKVAVVRDALAHAEQVGFAGDGPPDLAAAKLVPSGFRFARGWLADALTRANESYRPLTNWTQLADELLSSTEVAG